MKCSIMLHFIGSSMFVKVRVDLKFPVYKELTNTLTNSEDLDEMPKNAL